jgi:hypothetical protein
MNMELLVVELHKINKRIRVLPFSPVYAHSLKRDDRAVLQQVVPLLQQHFRTVNNAVEGYGVIHCDGWMIDIPLERMVTP